MAKSNALVLFYRSKRTSTASRKRIEVSRYYCSVGRIVPRDFGNNSKPWSCCDHSTKGHDPMEDRYAAVVIKQNRRVDFTRVTSIVTRTLVRQYLPPQPH
ncbi:hypothetical protein NPIL_631451 [Nephila pilipes]|uniref:Uncharacterized protein n=1 Tax=Nephila pilipes TaxID=299642 RepID=A0A8X6QC50_NEPPI|nr:hypothetical protein NPIL_631451 [Nephila pilipes]